MTPRIFISSRGLMSMVFTLFTLVTAAHAATITKAAIGSDLTVGTSWGGTAPGSGDVATWVSSSLGAGLTFGSPASWGGIGVTSALTNIGVTGAGTLTLGAGGIDMATAAVNLTLGTPIALGANQTWNVNSGRTLSASGIISGPSMALAKTGLGTLTLTGANIFDGATTIMGGTLIADTASTATVLNSASSLTFNGSGTFQLKGLAANTRSQTVNGLTLTSGAATIDANNTGTSTTIDLRGTGGALTIARSAGATVDFKATAGTLGTTAIVKTAQANDGTGILGAWATVNTGADWAINNGLGTAAAYTGYNTLGSTTLASAGTSNHRVASNPTTPTGDITMATTGTIDANTLRIADAATRTIDVRNTTTQGILRFGTVGGILTSGGNHIIGVPGVGNTGTITAGGADNAAGELVFYNASNLSINSVVANNGTGVISLAKSGAGTLTLNSLASTYSGGTFINTGSVTTNGTGNVTDTYFGTGPVTINSGATLALNRTYLPNNLTLNNTTVTAGNSFGSTLPAGFTITLNGVSTFSITGNLTIAGNITGTGGLTKTGATVVPVSGNNNYTGTTTISGGGLTFFKPGSLYNADSAQWIKSNITVTTGGSLILKVGGPSEFSTTQAGAIFGNLVADVNSNGLQAGAIFGVDAGTTAGPYTIATNLTDSIGVGGGAVGFRFFGNGTIGASTLELTGINNTYTGQTIIDRHGVLKVSSINSVFTSAALGTVHSASSSLGAPTSVATGTIQLGTSASFQGAGLVYTGTGETTDRVLSLGGGGGENYRLDQSGTGHLKFISNLVMTDTRGTKNIVLQGSTAGTGEITGVIPNATSSNLTTTLTKSGTGTWTLSAANLHAGVTTVSGGALVLAHTTALTGGIGATGGLSALTFNGGVIGLGTADTFARNLAVAGTITGVTFTGAGGWAAYGADRMVNLGGASASITWATAGTGLNAQTLILSNATATHTLDFQNPLDMGTAGRTVQVDNGAATLDGKLSGNITGTSGGNLTKTGLGTLAFTGTNNYVGTTTVSAGTLLVNSAKTGTGLITVASGASLGGTGNIAGAATYSTGAKALFTVTRDPVTQANTTPLTIAGVMAFNATEVQLNLPADLPSGTYTLATSSATPTGTVNATPVVLSGSYAAGFTSAVVSLDVANKRLLLTVNGLPTTPTKLAITTVNGGLSPVATAAFSVVVQAQDANGTARPVLANTALSLSLNSGSGPLGGTLNATILAGTSAVTISGVTYGTAESGVILTATRTSGDSLTSANSSSFTVLPTSTPSYLTVIGFPSPQTAGSPGSVTVTARTISGPIATTYTGTIAFTSSAVAAGLPANYTFVSGDNGVRVFTGVTLNTSGTQSLTATDTGNPTITGTQSGITITAGSAASLSVTGFPSPRATGLAGSVTVTARDAYGNAAPSYLGTVQFTSSDGAASLPANYTFTGGDSGVRTFTNGVTLNTVGLQSITATDTVAPAITGTQSAITAWVTPTSFTWRSPGTSGNWSDATKWAQNSGLDYAPIAAGQADYVLNFISGTYTATHNLSSGFLANQLNFAGTVTLAGTNALTLTNNGATLPQLNQNSANLVTINAPLSLAANVTLGGSSSGNVTITSAITGVGNLTKNNSGTLTLHGANNYGTTTINAGSVSMFSTANNLLGSGAVTVNSPATLALNGNNNLTNAFTLNGAIVTNGNSFSANLNGPINMTATSTFDLATTGNMNIGGNVSGAGGLTKIGTSGGALILAGASSFTGPVTVQAGTLSVASFNRISGGTATSNLGAPTTLANGTISLGNATTASTLLYFGPGETTDRVIRLAGTTGGAIISQTGTPSGLTTTRGESGLLKFTSDISIPGTAGVDNRKILTLTHVASSTTGANPGNGEISGNIGDSLLGNPGQLATSITKAGPGTWTLSGSNTYSGITRLQVGTLVITRSNALGAGALDITSGAKLRLDFIGTRQISVLTLDAGGAQPNGTYGSSSSSATNKDDTRFSGPGTLTIGPIASPTTTTLARTGGSEPSNGGVSLTFTATVAGPAPTGSVLFYDGLTLIGSSTLNGSLQASVTTTTLGAGVHAISAQYVGYPGSSPSTSAALTQTVVETRTATTTTLASGTNPSNKWLPVTLTATVTGGANSGSVTFYDDTTALGTATLNGSAQASLTTASLPVGWRSLSARYIGNATHAPSTSTTPLFQTVNPPPGNGKLKIFILAGQSNMQGKGTVEIGRNPNNFADSNFAGGLGSLRNMLNKFPNQYGYLADPSNPVGDNPGWQSRSDVRITYWSDPGTGENRRGDLDTNFGNVGEGSRLGPEYGFGNIVGSQLADQVLLIKYAFGGKSLAVDFRPPGAVAARGGVVGPYYTGMLARVNQVIANLSTYVPSYSGGGYEIAGFGWHQGWNDRVNGTYVAEYEANLTNLIQDLRTDLSTPNMPVSIGNTGMANAPSGPGSLIEAQGNVADPTKHPEFTGTVATVDTRPFDFGVALSTRDEGYHWNWNAETYYYIGEGMGKAMMAMLPADLSTPFSAWARDPAQGLTAGVNDGLMDDPDVDGIYNLLEFALLSNPLVSSQSALPTLTKSPGSWIFAYNRSVASRPPGATQIVEYGNNLTGWTQLTIPLDSTANVIITPQGLTDHVEVTLPDLGPKGFARLKVQQ